VAEVTTKDIKALRDATGAGMMDCKRALETTGGDIDEAMKLLREKGLTKAKERVIGSQGTVAVASDGNRAALVELKSETDFVAASPQFMSFVNGLAQLVLEKGPEGIADQQTALEDLKVLLKEGIDVGTVARFEAPEGSAIGTYLHMQGDGDKRRGVNGVLVEIAGGTVEQANEVALHIGFAKPKYLVRDEVPADVLAAERAEAENIARNEGKPEQALPKIVEGRVNGYLKETVLVEQSYVRDDKQTIAAFVAPGTVTRFSQAVITG
jgi:elongation factor Ts